MEGSRGHSFLCPLPPGLPIPLCDWKLVLRYGALKRCLSVLFLFGGGGGGRAGGGGDGGGCTFSLSVRMVILRRLMCHQDANLLVLGSVAAVVLVTRTPGLSHSHPALSRLDGDTGVSTSSGPCPHSSHPSRGKDLAS